MSPSVSRRPSNALFALLFVLMLVCWSPLACVAPEYSEEQQSALIAEIDAQEREGLISHEKAEALRQIIRELPKGGIDWEQIAYIAGGVLTVLTGVRVTRGAPSKMNQSQAAALKELLQQHLARKAAAESAEVPADEQAQPPGRAAA